MRLPALALAACSLVVTVAGLRAQPRVEHLEAGLAITRPPEWRTATLANVQANREHTRLADAELQAALATRAALPLMVFTKYEEPYAGLNPSINITVRQGLPGTPVALLSSSLAVMRRAFPDLRLLHPVRAAVVDGLPGAHVRLTYTLQNQSGGKARVLSRLWLVPRGRLMLLIGMSGSESEPDICEEEFSSALQSLSIAR